MRIDQGAVYVFVPEHFLNVKDIPSFCVFLGCHEVSRCVEGYLQKRALLETPTYAEATALSTPILNNILEYEA